ncbi:Hypothetical predicted protein, partial [Pelobates cultripes]
ERKRETEQPFFTAKNQQKPPGLQVGLQDGDHESGDSQDSCSLLPSLQDREGQIMPSILQKMLDAQSKQLLAQFHSSILELKKEIHGIGDRMAHLETKVEKQVTTHNSLVTKIQQIELHLSTHDTKLADLEGLSRRNNLRLRGMPESVAVGGLQALATGIFQTICPAKMLLLDCIHGVAKARAAPASVPKDILFRAHYHHIKEEILRASRNAKSLTEAYKDLQFLQIFLKLH